MMRGLLLPIIACTTALTLAAPAAAQQRAPARFDATAGEAPATPMRPSFRPLRIAKWSTAALTAAVAGIGLAAYTRADRSYEDLERACVDNPEACSQRLPNGAYADARLEAMYQDVLRMDERARLALIGSQIGLAASVIFFILDLREDATPPNIPYQPHSLRVSPGTRGGVEVGFGFALPGGS